ncbi:MAG: DUF1611 domain-containing protein, partial [Desulfobacteraceae bacterium]|nr:DUF1611 domain-containing protein [Desulfobacteraceae bacterium]
GTKVIAVALNGNGGSNEALSSYAKDLEKKTGIMVVCPLKEPMEKILPALRQFIQDHDQLPDTTAMAKVSNNKQDHYHG